MRLHDTAARGEVAFSPGSSAPVTVYACGPTVYDHAHIGNFRAFLFFDLVHRYLEWRGHEVRFVMNLTDVDDKVIAAAAKFGVKIGEYTESFADLFLEDAKTLGMCTPDAMPRATGHITGMIEFIQRLVEKGHAYQADDGAVYFSVKSFPSYGRLRGLDPSGLEAGARVEHDDYDKAEARDFALWKPADADAIRTGAAWDSPWGKGRPGWHLECSVMSTAELGAPIDLHLGGEDLVFPHHENEIAQSEAALGCTFVRHWLHVRHLSVNGRKMSKSLGNFITARGLLSEGFRPAAIRHLLISSHYRGELNFTRTGLDASTKAVQRLVDFESRLARAKVRAPSTTGVAAPGDTDAAGVGAPSNTGSLASLAEEALASFKRAMDQDFNSAEGLAALFVFLNKVNAELDRRAWVSRSDRDAALGALASMDSVLGLVELARPGREVVPEVAEEIERLVEERRAARDQRDFARADEIRAELLERGIVLEDGPDGTRWKVAG